MQEVPNGTYHGNALAVDGQCDVGATPQQIAPHIQPTISTHQLYQAHYHKWIRPGGSNQLVADTQHQARTMAEASPPNY